MSSPKASTLPVTRHHSVASSKPSLYEHFNSVCSYFSSSSASLPYYPTKKSTQSSNKNYLMYYIPAVLLLISPWMFPRKIHSEIAQYYTQIQEFQAEQRNLVQRIDGATKTVREVNTKIHTLAKENDLRFKELRENGGLYTKLTLQTAQYDVVEKTEEGMIRRLDVLEEHIQKTSAKMAIQKFGPAPYRVKVTLVDMRAQTSSFVIELAPLSEMPHAVYHFLQMVDQNLWDGLSLMLGKGTASSITSKATADYWVSQAMIMDKENGHNSWEIQRFEAANLTHLAFTEHSTNYPAPGKYKYSVAFSGHPGGPSFYIRMDDAEESVIDVHQQPSTFGTVVEGMDVLARYWSLSSHPKDGDAGGNSPHMELLTFQSMELMLG
jgi:cyclophilin family peptidyl-prolyl cis-trans isomerase